MERHPFWQIVHANWTFSEIRELAQFAAAIESLR